MLVCVIMCVGCVTEIVSGSMIVCDDVCVNVCASDNV